MPLGVHKTALMGAAGSGAAGLTAFGGIITQYVDSGDSKTYRVHTFRGSGKFVVSSGTADVDYLMIGGGGGGNAGNAGSGAAGGGGGAGGPNYGGNGGSGIVIVKYLW